MEQDALEIVVEEGHIHVVDVEAIASWGELLGVSDAEALALILSGYHPPPQTDDPDDNGWTRLYDTLIDEVQTVAVIQNVTEERVDVGTSGMTSDWQSILGRFGPEIVVAQAEALAEDARRTALSGVEIPVEPRDESIVEHVKTEVATYRSRFRERWNPLTTERED